MGLRFHGAILIIFVGCHIVASQSSSENVISGEMEDRTGFSRRGNVTPSHNHSGQMQQGYGYDRVQLNILAEVARLKLEEIKVLIPKLVNIQQEMEELLSPNNTDSSVALYEERIDEAGNNLLDVTNELIGLQAVSRHLASLYRTVVSQRSSAITRLEDLVDSGVDDKLSRADLSLLLHGDRLSFGRTPIVPSIPAESNKFLVEINNRQGIQLENLQYGLNRMVWGGDSVAPGSISGHSRTTFSFRSYKQPATAIFAYQMRQKYLLLAFKEPSLSSAAIYAGVLDSLNRFSDAQVLLVPESTGHLLVSKNDDFKIRLNYKLDEDEKTYKVAVLIEPNSTWG